MLVLKVMEKSLKLQVVQLTSDVVTAAAALNIVAVLGLCRVSPQNEPQSHKHKCTQLHIITNKKKGSVGDPYTVTNRGRARTARVHVRSRRTLPDTRQQRQGTSTGK